MDFSQYQISRNKIFKSIFNLQYKDQKLEERYQGLSKISLKKTFSYFSQFLLFFGIFLSTLEGVLFFSQKKIENNRNLKYNFYFSLLHLLITISIFMYILMFDVVEKKLMKNFCLCIIHFCYNNFFLSLISIIIVFFKMEIEMVSFTFLLQILTNCLLSFFLHRNFLTSFIICMLCLTFEFSFLLGIHVIRGIIYYLIVHTAFTVISLAFVYMYEFMTRKFYYSFLKLAKEKDYFLETIEYFNISYFSARNKTIKRAIKMDFVLSKEDQDNKIDSSDHHITLKSIEKVMNNLISIEHFSKDIDNYLIISRSKKNFQFKKLIKIITSSEQNKHFFKKFSNVGILSFKNQLGEESYIQMFMKIKIKKTGSMNLAYDMGHGSNTFYKNFDVKIEGILLDVTQSFLKKETQLNSIVLSKFINDINSPLFLLEQLVNNYKSFLDNMTHITKSKKIIKCNSINSEIDEYSNNLRIVSQNINENIELINNFANKQNSLSSISRINQDYKHIDIRTFISSCVEFYALSTKFNIKKQNIRVYSVIDNNIPQNIFTVETYLKQILMNLLSNALKFTFNGEIKVVCKLKSKLELTQERKFVEVNIIDTGVGIDEENLNKICNQGELILINKLQGAGLGLYIVTDLLRKIGSKLSVYSVKNKGSNFSFEIPINKEIEKDEKFLQDSNEVTEKSLEIKLKEVIVNSEQIPLMKKEIISDGFFFKNTEKEFREMKFKPIVTTANDEVDQKTVIYNHTSPMTKEVIREKYFKIIRTERKRSNSMDDEYFKFKNKLYLKFLGLIEGNRQRKTSLISLCNNGKPYSTSNNIGKRLFETGEIPYTKYCYPEFLASTNKKLGPKHSISLNSLDHSSPSKTNFNILIIDDDVSYLRQSLSIINMISLELDISISDDTACDSIEALWKIYNNFRNKSVTYDLIFIDENMPFLSGKTFVKMYNEYFVNGGLYKVPFISVSTEKLRIQTDIKDINTHYFESYLTKPCRKSELKSIILKYIESRCD